MGFHVRPSAAALAVILSAVALSGCTAAGGAYSVLDREAEARDEVPADLPGYAWDDVDQATARFVGEGDGTSLWLARARDDAAACLLAYVDADTWVIGCGGNGAPFSIGGVTGTFTVVPDDAPAPDGMTRVSDNVYTTTGS
ncbi:MULTISPECIES: hypothetical protein [unclassified Microbacterium]|uniref:hypothetical protein n=1 Tax=unclassified Microbacterium TaxID=2609290 RepID=UPI0024695E84|nr:MULTISPECIES: hypothetical protein [unclassified Microbacterium]MDH5132094.1 hypothetical protein [Microbacterium sp. RD10]MDH5135959.1 hypothetical protein [Microbacterium sp. RD11]MDH5143843.1 hypothetical protein [Microbacterium sp. RD12]MDH5153201.1 hypothetical protein [Microbacterium sp. RD06]MDH5164715.1 hypothetical protein [Microbacterium sp. RD02]